MIRSATHLAVLIPVKAFHLAKQRLSPALSDEQRLQLVKALATTVVEAASPLPVAIVCDDDAVASWARSLGAQVIWTPARGLNRAVADGVATLAEQGVAYVTVAHGDLARASSLASLEPIDGVTLIPDRHGDGTNVLQLPTNLDFTFSYGPRSFELHIAECERLDIPTRVIERSDLGFDVDVPDDLAYLDQGLSD